jgi:hypothetical protein
METVDSHGAPPGATWRGRLKKGCWIIPSGCLTLVLVVVTLNWITLRALSPPVEEGVRELSFQETLGQLEGRGPAPTPLPLEPPLAFHLLPGVLSVTDAVESRGTWVLLDRRLGKVHILDPEAGLVRSMGGEGPGPEELSNPMGLAVADTVLWVLNQGGLVLDRLSLAGTFHARRRLQGGGCLVGLAKGLGVTGQRSLHLLRLCPATLPGPGTSWLERVSMEGELTPILSLPMGNPGSRKLHPLRQPALAAREDRLFLGTLDTPCMKEVFPDGREGDMVCLPPYARPRVPSNRGEELQSRFRGITDLGLLPLEIPEELPWYDRVFSVPRGLVFRRLRGVEERDLVLVAPGEGSWVTDTLFPEQTFVGEETILVVRDRLEGTEVTLYPVPWG